MVKCQDALIGILDTVSLMVLLQQVDVRNENKARRITAVWLSAESMVLHCTWLDGSAQFQSAPECPSMSGLDASLQGSQHLSGVSMWGFQVTLSGPVCLSACLPVHARIFEPECASDQCTSPTRPAPHVVRL